jgi:transcriptional regulator with XRE-family HTH domain
MPVGQRLKSFREARGWSLDTMVGELRAVGLVIQRMALYRIEEGDRQRFSEDELRILAKFLGITPNELLDWND